MRHFAISRALAALAIVVGMTVGQPAYAAARDPLDYPLRQYGFILAAALFGGLVSWISKVNAGTVRAWSLLSLIGELCTSALAGLLCFWLCEWQAFNPLLTASLVGIAGHMGTRALSMFERVAEKRWGITSPAPPEDAPGSR